MPKDPLKSPQLYINRELSWLEFNQRVLDEGLSDELPLLERLKFFAIVSSNLDEFFLVRVAGLMRRRAAKVRRRDVSGMTPAEQIEAISLRVHKMYAQLADGIRGVLEKLARHGLVVWSRKDWTEEHRQFLKSYFTREIMPILTPLAMDELDPRPLLPGLQMYVAAVIAPAQPRRMLKVPRERIGRKDRGCAHPPAIIAVYRPAFRERSASGLVGRGYRGESFRAFSRLRSAGKRGVSHRPRRRRGIARRRSRESPKRDGKSGVRPPTPRGRAPVDYIPARSAPEKMAYAVAQSGRRERVRDGHPQCRRAYGVGQPRRVRRSETRGLAAPAAARS